MDTPAIPIQNIYYLLCYAWDRLEQRDIVDVDARDATSLFSLFARVLRNGLKHLIRRGLDQGYINYAEETRCPRGKISFAPMIKRNLFSKAMAHCEYDEFSHNVPHNQIIKTTLKILMDAESTDADLKKELVALYRRLNGIDDIALSSAVFSRVVLHSNNAIYDFLLKICRLVYDNLLPEEGTGRYKFRDFTREKNMAGLFEEFVRNFYRIETPQYKVGREDIFWDVADTGSDAAGYLPKMITDISIEKEGHKIVIDTKFYKESLTYNYNTEKIKPENLYQIMAYLKNLEAKGGINSGCSGILLYPTVRREMHIRNSLLGHTITAATINLNQDWSLIHQDLMQLIERA